MNNDCEAVKAAAAGRWYAKYAGEYLYEKRGAVRLFHSERAAMKAAYFARDGKDRRPAWRKRK